MPTIPREVDGQAAMRLVEVVQQLSQARSAEAIRDIVTHAARELVGADGAAFVLRDGDHCHYVEEEAIGPLWRGQRFPLTACISGWSMLHREAAVIPEVLADPRIPQAAYAPTFVTSLVMVPIRRDDPIGAVGTYWAQRHEATEAEVYLLQALADTTAVALESAELVRDLELRVGERTARLEAANRELEAFSYSVAHDLRNPLGAIVGFADIVLHQFGSELTAPVSRYLQRITQEVERMDGRIEDYLMLARSQRIEIRPEPVDLGELVAELVSLRAPRAELAVRGELVAWCDRDLMRAALENLVTNALKFTPPEQTPRLEVGQGPDGAYYLRDHGVGFDMAEAERLFKPFSRLSSAQGVRGSGIGLATVARILERHQGAIWAEGRVGEGATFFFRLPPRAD